MSCHCKRLNASRYLRLFLQTAVLSEVSSIHSTKKSLAFVGAAGYVKPCKAFCGTFNLQFCPAGAVEIAFLHASRLMSAHM